jgi:hypothetical protein
VQRIRSLAVATALVCAACSAGQLGDPMSGPAVSPGTVTFRLLLPSTRSFCDTVSGCLGPPEHLSIRDGLGNWLSLTTGWCEPECGGGCGPYACPTLYCGSVQAVAVTEIERTWTGAYFPQSTCGQTTCFDSRWAPPGHYVAGLCATPGVPSSNESGAQTCLEATAPECVEVAFDIPGPPVIELSLPAFQGD